jgi:hypothetical protein
MTYPPPGNPDPYGQQPQPQQPDPYNPYGAAPGSPAAPQYGQPPQSPYAAQPYQQPYVQAAPPTNTMAILALVFAFVFAPLAIVFGHMAKKQIKQTGEGGEGLATAGLIMGYIFTGLSLLVCCVYVVAFGMLASSSSNY